MEQDEQVSQTAQTAVGPNGRPLTAGDQELVEKYRRTFIGSYSHTLDGKGRMVVPQAFRDDLGQRFYICPSLDMQSISLYTELDWARERDHLEKLGQLSSQFKDFLFIYDQLSYRDQEFDGQGRVLLPAKIRQLILKEEKEVVICGAGNHIRVCVAEDNEKKLQAALAHSGDIKSLYDELSKLLLNH